MSSQLREALKTKAAYEGLLKSRGWLMLVETMKVQIDARVNNLILTPLNGAEHNIYSQEFAKGEVAGIKLVLALAQQQVEMSKDIAESLKEEPDDDAE